MPAFTFFTVAVALLLSGSEAKMRRREDPPKGEFYPERKSTPKCEELCKKDTGLDADFRDCMTECSVYTDVMTHDLDKAFHDFTQDESFNEKGGEKMKEAHNEEAPEEAYACGPSVDLEKKPTFEDLDTNGDKVIDFEEALAFSEKACITDEKTEQMFSEADLNQDKVLNKEEWDNSGEDTKSEEAMDKALEKVSQGDDEYDSVQNPPLEEFDENKDGALDESEAKEAFEHELERRTEHEEVPKETMEELEPEIKDAIDEVDTNDDGEISGDEYIAKDEGSDMGQELKEEAHNDEDAKELDDLPRAQGAAPAPAASLIQRHSAGFLRKRRDTRKYAQLLQKARQHRHRYH